MGLKKGFAFEFESPEHWAEFRDGNRYVFQGPEDEELIISGVVVAGGGASAGHDDVRDQVIANALKSMRHAVDVPDLTVNGGPKERLTAQKLRCWEIDAETTDGGVVFLQGVVESGGAVLLVTFEAPNSHGARSLFQRFIDNVRPASGSSYVA